MTKHYHFIGIGGIGMGALALLALGKGCVVSGSDTKDGKMTETLRSKGATVYIGHEARQVRGASHVIFSTAITPDNPELVEARRCHIPILRRAELLAELMDGHTVITVAGAHGKTTTTAMAANLLTRAGLHPTSAVGGIVHNFAANAVLGKGQYFVAEADESDGSFLNYSPYFSVITNLDREHMDYYGTWENLLEIHRQFIGRTVAGGRLICCGDDGPLRQLVEESGRDCVFYGFEEFNVLRADNISLGAFESSFDCIFDGKSMGCIRLNVPGRHNILNALACVGVGLSLGVDFSVIAASLGAYEGVKRRLQRKGLVQDILVVDDYGHHPTEIRATLDAARLMGRPMTVVFQPHRYTRFQSLYADFLKELKDVPHLIVMDIYAASEPPIAGLSSERFVSEIKKMGSHDAVYLPHDRIVSDVVARARAGDLILTLGAGDVTALSDEIVEALKGKA